MQNKKCMKYGRSNRKLLREALRFDYVYDSFLFFRFMVHFVKKNSKQNINVMPRIDDLDKINLKTQ